MSATQVNPMIFGPGRNGDTAERVAQALEALATLIGTSAEEVCLDERRRYGLSLLVDCCAAALSYNAEVPR